jgi:LmbE family N-acetylglucosaminyl deacetylase
MLNLPLFDRPDLQRVLCLGAHCDDVEIGMGGTLTELARRRPDVTIQVCVLTGNKERTQETMAATREMLGAHPQCDVDVFGFRNGHFPWQATEIKAHLEKYKSFDPQLVFTHYRHDHHQDHRTVSELTANTFRDHLVLEYEILKYDGDLGNPNVFIPLTEQQLETKIDTLMRCFKSQLDKQWFTRDVFHAMARIRGVHGATPYAEAFYCNKLTLT